MKISSTASKATFSPLPVQKQSTTQQADANPSDRVTLSGKLGKIAKGAFIGGIIGAAATGIGFAGALLGLNGALLGIAGAGALGVGLAHKMDMMVPSTFSAPEQAGAEKTFYGATAGLMGGAFGALTAGIGVISGGGFLAAAVISIGYASVLAATRNTIMGVGEQFPNSL